MPGGATKTPLVLYYRDGLEVFRHIFGNPEFKNSMSFIPQKIYSSSEKDTGIYTEIFTGDWAWEAQVNTSTRRSFSHVAGSATNWRNSRSCNPWIRQDTSY